MGESSRESEFIVLKERKLISTSAVLNGTMRFAFLLETCPPGSVPDANLLASVLDLVSYVFNHIFIWNSIHFSIAEISKCSESCILDGMRIFCTLLQQGAMANMDETKLSFIQTFRSFVNERTTDRCSKVSYSSEISWKNVSTVGRGKIEVKILARV